MYRVDGTSIEVLVKASWVNPNNEGEVKLDDADPSTWYSFAPDTADQETSFVP
jgi:hypothetical protein